MSQEYRSQVIAHNRMGGGRKAEGVVITSPVSSRAWMSHFRAMCPFTNSTMFRISMYSLSSFSSCLWKSPYSSARRCPIWVLSSLYILRKKEGRDQVTSYLPSLYLPVPVHTSFCPFCRPPCILPKPASRTRLRLSLPAFTHCCASQTCLHALLRLSKPAFAPLRLSLPAFTHRCASQSLPSHRCASQSLPSRAATIFMPDAPRRPTTASCTPRSENTPLPGRSPNTAPCRCHACGAGSQIFLI